MGNWNISISGVGGHHNNLPTDAEAIFKKFVTELRGSGHSLSDATITIGSAIHDVPFHRDGDIYECYEMSSGKRLGCTSEPQYSGNRMRFAGSGSDQDYIVIGIIHNTKSYSCVKI
jgi:hypothetical protein